MRSVMHVQTNLRARIAWIAVALGAIVLGLASRRSGSALPEFVAAYAGDALWALLVYALVGAMAPAAAIRARAASALAFAFAIEFSQLIGADWLDAIRNSTLGALVLGRGFLWSDLACYTVGVTLGALGEALVRFARSDHRR